MPGPAAVERRLVLADSRDRAAELEDRERGQRRSHPHGAFGHDVDDLVVQRPEVGGAEVVPPARRERRVEHRLMPHERLRRTEVQHRRTELPHGLHDTLAVLHRPCVATDHRDHGEPVQLGRDDVQRGHPTVHEDRGQLVGHVGDPVSVEPQNLGRLLHGPEDGAGQHDRPHGVQPELELGDDTEVPAPAPDAPEELGVLALVRLHEPTVGGHDVDGQQLIDGQPVLAHQPSDAPAEGQSRQPGVGDDAGRNGQPEGLGLAVELAEQHPRLGPRRPGLGVDADPPHRREVDEDPVVTRRVPREAVPAAADGEGEAGPASEGERLHDVGDPSAPRDERRMSVDRPVPDPAVLVVAGVAGAKDVAAEGVLELGERGVVELDLRLDGRHVPPFCSGGYSETEVLRLGEPGQDPRSRQLS